MPRPLALAALVTLLAPAQALAHARLLHARPAVGSTVRAAPAALALSFSERIDVAHSTVTVSGPAGPVQIGPLATDAERRIVRVPIRTPLAPGAYQVRWAMTSEDSHHTEGDFRFRVTP